MRSYQVNYSGEFNNVFHNKDVLVHANLVDPALNNFFGFGNETMYDKTKGIDYYRVRYKYLYGRCIIAEKIRRHYTDNGRPC